MEPQDQERADRLDAPPDLPLQLPETLSRRDSNARSPSFEGARGRDARPRARIPVVTWRSRARPFRPRRDSRSASSRRSTERTREVFVEHSVPDTDRGASSRRLSESSPDITVYPPDSRQPGVYWSDDEDIDVFRPKDQNELHKDTFRSRVHVRPPYASPPYRAASPLRMPRSVPVPPPPRAVHHGHSLPRSQGFRPSQQLQRPPQQPQRRNHQQYAHVSTAAQQYNLSYVQGDIPGRPRPVIVDNRVYAQRQPSSPQGESTATVSSLASDDYLNSHRRFSQEQRAFRPTGPGSLLSRDTSNEAFSDDDESEPGREFDPLSRVHVEDGSARKSFIKPETLRNYLDLYPEADNDRACRVFRYGPACPTELLMPLFERLDFARFSQYPYGLSGNRAITDAWGSGSCKCDDCESGRSCGEYVLHKNLRYLTFWEAPDNEQSFPTPTIQTVDKTTTIRFGMRSVELRGVDWNLQLFRLRSRTFTTTHFACNAVIYQSSEERVKVRSSALEYVFEQLECVLEEWANILPVCAQFLAYFRMEVLEERLETDRTIIRTLVVAAQLWENLRMILKQQLSRVDFLRDVKLDPRWTDDYDDYYGAMLSADDLVQRLEGIEVRIMTELVQETDSLIQRVTNLISIDEGYRSRDQNESVRRLTWITFIFLPLLFTSALFSMQIDLLANAAPWRNYVYACSVLMVLVLLGWAVLRFRRRLKRAIFAQLRFAIATSWNLPSMLATLCGRSLGSPEVDLEQQTRAAGHKAPTLLAWAATSGNLAVINTLLNEVGDGSGGGQSKGSALILAIQHGHIAAAELILSRHADVTVSDNEGVTSLHWAAKAGLKELCQKLIQTGASPASRDISGATPVDWAMQSKHVVLANLLLTGQKKVVGGEARNLYSIHSAAAAGNLAEVKDFAKNLESLEVRDKDGRTVLMHGVMNGHVDVVIWLLDSGRCNVSAVDKQGTTPLHEAVKGGWYNLAELLLTKGADVKTRDTYLYQPIHYVSGGDAERMLSLLTRFGADITAKGGAQMSLLHISVLRGSAGSVSLQTMINAGCDLNDRDETGQTALHTAAAWDNITCARMLVEASHELMARHTLKRYTPLMVAAKTGSIDVMRYLLERGADQDVEDSHHRSLADLAVRWGNPEVIRVLREHGARFMPTDDEGKAESPHPIWDLIRSGKGSKTLRQLLNSGLNVNYTWKSVTLLQNALEVGNEPAVACLLEQHASVEARDDYGWTALHSAVYGGDFRCLLYVLKEALDMGVQDEQGWTPLDLAIFYGRKNMIRQLDVEGTAKEKMFDWPWGRRNDAWATYAALSRPEEKVKIFEVLGDCPGTV